MKNAVWLRVFFLLVVVQALLLGRSLFWPDLISATLPWQASPLNARFIAALYWMGAISAFLCTFAARYAAVRITLIEVGFVTGALLLLTLPHIGEFNPEHFPYRWMIFYTVDPVLIGFILWYMRGRDPAPAGWNRNAALFIGYAVVLLISGGVLLLAPALAAQLWPWSLPTILGQVYSIFFLTFALGGVLAARDPRREGVWIYAAANLAMLSLIVAVSLWHADRFKTGPMTWIWYGLCAAGIVAFAATLIRRPAQIATQGAAI